MNITSTFRARKSEPSRANALALRKQLQEEIKLQRAESAELRDSGEISRKEFRQNKDFLNQLDVDRVRKRANLLSTSMKTIAGFAAGSLAGYQGGWVGGLAGGVLGASVSDGLTLSHDTPHGLAFGASVLSAAAMGFGGAMGGIVGAVAGGIGGALAVNYGEVPVLAAIAFGS